MEKRPATQGVPPHKVSRHAGIDIMSNRRTDFEDREPNLAHGSLNYLVPLNGFHAVIPYPLSVQPRQSDSDLLPIYILHDKAS
jgi:hypothetical protein